MIQIKQSRLLADILGFAGIVIYPYVIVNNRLNGRLINHELIHVCQILEMKEKHPRLGTVIFYLRYVLQWICAGFSYRKIPYELEAMQNQNNLMYIFFRYPQFWGKLKPYLEKFL
jgi:hypothetical protein